VLAVTVNRRLEVVTGDQGKHRLEPAIEVILKPKVVADPSAAVSFDINEQFLEALTLEVSLSEEGLLQSINTQASRDLTPVVSLIAKLIPLTTSLLLFAEGAAENFEGNTLEEEWATRHPLLARSYTALEQRTATLLDQLSQSLKPKDVSAVGAAIHVLRGELALIDRVRREWMVGWASAVETVLLDLKLSDVIRLEGQYLPATLAIDPESVLPPLRPLVDAGVAIAVADQFTAGPASLPGAEDAILVRRARPVWVGIYRHPFTAPQPDQPPTSDQSNAADAGDVVSDLNPSTDLPIVEGLQWQLTDALQIRVVDEVSPVDTIDVRGNWWQNRTVELSFHPNQTLKTYGITTASTIGAVVTAAGGVIDAAVAAGKTLAERPTAEEDTLQAAKQRLDMAKTSSEMAQLAATQERAAELAELEQRAKLAELRSKL
jgi:hypothetical protein